MNRPNAQPLLEQRLWRRIAVLAALLLCQGLLLGIIFDSATPREKLPAGWWTELFKYTHLVMPLAAIVGAAVLLVAGPRMWHGRG